MAKSTKTAVSVTGIPPQDDPKPPAVIEHESLLDPDDPGELDDDMPPDAALQAVLNELGEGGTASIRIYKLNTETKREAYLYGCSPQEFSIDEIARRYGGGEYSVRVYEAPGNRLITRKRLDIAEPLGGFKAPAIVAGTGDIAAQISASLNSTLAAMQNQNMELMKLMITAQRPAAPSSSLTEMITALSALQRMNPPPPPAPQSSPMDTFKQFREFMSMMQDIAPPAGDSAGDAMGMRVIGRTLEKFLDMWGQNQGRAAAPQAPDADPGAPEYVEPHAPVVAIETAALSEDDQMKLFIQQGVEHARNNADIAPIAQLIADHAPDEIIALICDDPDWFKKLCAVVPEVANYPQWFQQLRDKVDELTAEPEPGDNPPKS